MSESLWTLTERAEALVALVAKLDPHHDRCGVRLTFSPGSGWCCDCGAFGARETSPTPEDAIVAVIDLAMKSAKERVETMRTRLAEATQHLAEIASAHDRCNAAKYE